MIRPFKPAILFLAIFLGPQLHAQSLKTIDPPGGGKIVYGQVTNQTTEAGAMGAILSSLHKNLGERPQVGKLFQIHGTESVAAFFSVTSHYQGAKPMQIGGLIIATKVTSDSVQAALVSDEASRFPKTLSPLMKTLFQAWHPFAEAPTSKTGGSSGPVAPLHHVVLSDNSASVSLPDGWNLAPSMSQMGTIVAQGPNEETAELGITFLTGDTNNPQTQNLLRQLRAGYLRNTSYATGTYYPFGADPAKTFVYLIQDLRKKANLPPATYNFTSVTPVSSPGQRCAHLSGTAEMGDGKGQRELNMLFCEQQPNSAGAYLSSAYMTTAPVSVAARDRATLGAILQSFNVNQQVVARQANQIAAPVIEQIHAIGRAAAEQARSVHEQEDIHNSSVYKQWDSNDKRSQEFENYQLGYSVISTTDNTAHGTFWNEDADALVKSNPSRFEYVNAPNYWKGIDY